jgi:hypothetical protein
VAVVQIPTALVLVVVAIPRSLTLTRQSRQGKLSLPPLALVVVTALRVATHGLTAQQTLLLQLFQMAL